MSLRNTPIRRLIVLLIAAAAPGLATAQTATVAAVGPSPTASAAPSPAPPPQSQSPSASPTIDSILQGVSPPVPGPASPAAPPAPPPMTAAAMSEAYDAALRGAARSAQVSQGALDGGWTVFGRDGERLYRLQFADRGLGLGLAEGAWRDLKTNARLMTSGFIASVAYDGVQLILKFFQSDANDQVVVTLKPSGGGWSGQLVRRGVATPVALKRG